MLSYVYPFLRHTGMDSWIGCKPILILYFLYFLISFPYMISRFLNKDGDSTGTISKSTGGTWIYAAYWLLPLLHLFMPSTGGASSLVISIAERYLQYENLLGGILILILIFAILNNAPWQLIHILDQAENVLIWGTVSSTILTHQINSLWVANILWFVVLGMICITKWRIWEKVVPINRSDYETSGFQPVKMYEQLLPRQKKLSDQLVNLIRSHDSGEPLTICVAGKWGAGKTSIVNGTINFLKTDSTSCKYEVLYINAMDLDTSASLFAYVFDRLRDILKKRGAYVGLGSEYKQFIALSVYGAQGRIFARNLRFCEHFH